MRHLKDALLLKGSCNSIYGTISLICVVMTGMVSRRKYKNTVWGIPFFLLLCQQLQLPRFSGTVNHLSHTRRISSRDACLLESLCWSTPIWFRIWLLEISGHLQLKINFLLIAGQFNPSQISQMTLNKSTRQSGRSLRKQSLISQLEEVLLLINLNLWTFIFVIPHTLKSPPCTSTLGRKGLKQVLHSSALAVFSRHFSFLT